MATTTAELIGRVMGRQNAALPTGPNVNVQAGLPPAPIGQPAPVPQPTPNVPAPVPQQPAPVPAPAPQPAPAPVPQPMAAQPADMIDPNLIATLQQRLAGEGIGPTFEQITQNVYEPQAALMDQAFDRSYEQGLEDLVSRGVLASGETQRFGADLFTQLATSKAGLLGQLALDFENNRQENINAALNQLGILEGQRLSSRTAIETANIGATAAVKAAALSAGATKTAAQISARARLQESQNDYELAIRQLDQDMMTLGVDGTLFQTDPAYREEVLLGYKYFEEQKQELMLGALEQQLLGQALEPAQVPAGA